MACATTGAEHGVIGQRGADRSGRSADASAVRNKPDATMGVEPDAGHDSSLTDFLAPPQAADELGRLGKYRILKILGHGGMGVVFQGRGSEAETQRRHQGDAADAWPPAPAPANASCARPRPMAAVEHDHIVRIYQVDEDRGVPFLAMEFLKGEPLDERLKREEQLPLDEVLRIGREIAEGLAAAHATGLIHRDIKPGNIWLEAPAQDRVEDPRLRPGRAPRRRTAA